MNRIGKSKTELYKELVERCRVPQRVGLFPLRVYRFLQRKRREYRILVRDLFYLYVYTPIKVFQIRHKKKIKVLFVLTELGPWKTELLYRRMLEHERFEPILGLSTSAEYEKALAEDAKLRVAEYCTKKKYVFCDLDKELESGHDPFAVDIVFYQKPYGSVYHDKIFFDHHLNALFCYAMYALRSLVADVQINLPLFKFAWQNYFENELTKIPLSKIRNYKRDNMVITGLPVSDSLLRAKSEYADPWKYGGECKRVIYAPHWTIFDGCMVKYSTFLEYADFMLKLAVKYRHEVQWAFKPHPLLYSQLIKVWGKDKADDYYSFWCHQENTQLESGEYAGLFMHSDAMIHDCGSFTTEYQYTMKPAMYLLRGEGHEDNLNECAKKAFDLHYKGKCQADIESFIENIIAGNDPRQIERKEFFDSFLVPPNGKSACDNIINAILGKVGYR